VNFVLYCLTGRAFRSECRKLLWSLWILKDIRITCTRNPDSTKYHQNVMLTDRHRFIQQKQQQQQQGRFSSPRQNMHL
jgi:hypothetical protein